jgi:hypothetical protein
MSLYIKKKCSKEFQLPTEGQHPCVLAAVQDLGFVESKYGESERIRFVWIVGDEAEDSNGKPLIVMQSMNKSLHEKATLFQTIKAATGSEPDEDTDIEGLVGTQAQIVIVHAAGRDRMYANVQSVDRPLPKQRVEIPDDWEPPKVKLPGARPAKPSTRTSYVAENSDIPF